MAKNVWNVRDIILYTVSISKMIFGVGTAFAKIMMKF